VEKPVIVGFDPGTTAALAIIDTRGNVLYLKSKRGFKRSEILNRITRIGKPLLIAGDRNPPSKSVEKLASILSCKTFYPKKSLSLREKNELTKEFLEIIEDDHEKDALASALYAFKFHLKVFKRIKSVLSSLGLENFYERVTESVVLGESKNISDAINKLMNKPRKKERKVAKKKKPVEKEVEELRRRIKQLETDLGILKEYNQSLKKRLSESKKRIEYYKKKSKEKIDIDSIGILKRKMSELKQKLEENKTIIRKLKLLREFELEGFVPLIELREIRMNLLDLLNETIGLKGRVIIAEDSKNAQLLNDFNIEALVAEKIDEKILEKVNFPIILRKDISIERMKNVSVVRREDFEKALKEARKKGFIEWLKEYKKRRF